MATSLQTDTTTRLPDRFAGTPLASRLRALGAAAALLVLGTLAAPLVSGGVGLLADALGHGDDLVRTYAVSGTLATLSLAAIALAYRRVRPLPMPVRVPDGREWPWVVVGILAPLLGAVVLQLGAAALGVGAGETATSGIGRFAATNPVLFYSLAILSALFVVAPAEELLYRGVVQGRLREEFGPAVAIGLTSLGFGAGHVFSYVVGGSDPLSGAVAIALATIVLGGVVLGVLYERTGNLGVTIVAHGLSNALVLTVSLAAVL
ncbi:CPBP family intramembrane metalloprotease [Salinirubellus salinus]|uniref:CPBP family intramembrane metalloprotease n=1 Tax=Salinirubellus salinus TaxID=1364945 RepID=A0A9E7UAZ4_9EURY|nr:CPBP family intramembrane glutamic endopeptidase [Salinirubellus salinus]UWM54304.1 CPBP family intramembrane metalloprotease [Salinirubellus salinus]